MPTLGLGFAAAVARHLGHGRFVPMGTSRKFWYDDAISSGSTALAPWQLIESLGAEVLAYDVAMRQGKRWQQTLGPERAARVVGVFDSPLLQLADDGWIERC